MTVLYWNPRYSEGSYNEVDLYIVVLVTCKNEKDPIKNEGTRVQTSLLFDFSVAQGQLTLYSVVEFRQNSNSSKLL